MNEDFLKTIIVAELEDAGFEVSIQDGECVVEKGDYSWRFSDARMVLGFSMAVDYFVEVE